MNDEVNILLDFFGMRFEMIYRVWRPAFFLFGECTSGNRWVEYLSVPVLF